MLAQVSNDDGKQVVFSSMLAEELVNEALNLLFEKYGRSPIA
jgi:hypothetical protein